MAQLGFVVAGSRSAASPAASIAPAKPAVKSIAGVLLAAVTSKNNAVHSTATAGWTKLVQTNSGASFTASLWIAAETAAAPTFTWTGSVACSAQIAYWADIDNPLDVAAITAVASTSTGATNPHTSTGFNSTRANSLAVYVDVSAANTALQSTVGWTEDVDNGSATDGGRTVFGHKALATIGTASGGQSITGAVAAWVNWQLEIVPTVAAGLQESKVAPGAWLDTSSAFGLTKLEAGAWIQTGGLGYTKAEAGAWLDAGTLQESKVEAGAWLDTGALEQSKVEAGAWLEGAIAPASNRRMSLM